MNIPSPAALLAWCERYVSVEASQERGIESVPFQLRDYMQEFWFESRVLQLQPGYEVTVMPRQVGKSTTISARVLSLLALVPGTRVNLVLPDEDSLLAFRVRWDAMVAAAIEAGAPLTVEQNRDEVWRLSNGSTLRRSHVGKSAKKATRVVRSQSPHLVWLTEVAYWEHDQRALKAIAPALRMTLGGVLLDSTPPDEPDMGTIYRTIVRQALKRQSKTRLFFVPWHAVPQYRTDRPARAPFSQEERALMAAPTLLDARQIGWRRETQSDPGADTDWRCAYPERITDALGVEQGGAIAPEIRDAWHEAQAEQRWIAPLDGATVNRLLPDRLRSAEPDDPFCHPHHPDPPPRASYLRVYQAPTPRLQLYSPRDTEADPLAALRRWTEDQLPDETITIGVDSSWSVKDPRVATVTRGAEILAILTHWGTSEQFTGDLARLILWYRAGRTAVEQAADGPHILRLLQRQLPPGMAALIGAHEALTNAIPGVIAWTTTEHSRPQMCSAALRGLKYLPAGLDPQFCAELLSWDPYAPSRGGDDTMDAYGIAQAQAQLDAVRRHSPGATLASASRPEVRSEASKFLESIAAAWG